MGNNRRFLLILLLAWTSWSAAPLRAANADKTYEHLKILVDVLDYIQENYVDEPEIQKLIYGAAGGMVRVLDPFSQFMDPEAHREIKNETEGQYGGLGLRLGMKDDWLTVITPLPGTPAYRAGILPNDRVVDIEGETTRDINLSEALTKLRGSAGTKVKLTILRAPDDGGADAPWSSHVFTINREVVKIESVQAWMLENNVGYLRIIEFTAKTADDVLGELKKLRKAGLSSLILDLRNNPGGLLSSAVDISSDFIGDNKLIVYTQGRKPESRQEFRSGAKAPYGDIPLVVLVNGGSASGSEIVAGALQDHHRAVIIGMRTYGKASVQSVIPLSDGSGLRLTVARYYTPLGRSIHRDEKKKTGGIVPDIVVPIAREVEAKLYNQWELIYSRDKKPKSIAKKEELVPDEILNRGVELLKARDVLGTLEMKGK